VDTRTLVINEADVTSTYFVLIGIQWSWTGSAISGHVHIARTDWTGGRRCEQVQISSVRAM